MIPNPLPFPSPTFPFLPLRRCRIYDGRREGVIVLSGGRGRLERCGLWGNAEGGVLVEGNGDPTLSGCTLSDHATFGVRVAASARGRATVGADCAFARNAGGDVQRDGGAR